MVFGLALSIGSLFLILNLAPDVVQIFEHILFFGFGFVIIVMTWLGYSRTMAVLPVEVTSALFLNIVLLFCVAIEPYLLYILFTFTNNAPVSYYSSIAYGLDIGTMFLILATLTRLVLKENRESKSLQLQQPVLERFRQFMTMDYVIGGFFIASTLPIFWIQTPIGYLRFILWYSSFAFFFTLQRKSRKEKKLDSPDHDS